MWDHERGSAGPVVGRTGHRSASHQSRAGIGAPPRLSCRDGGDRGEGSESFSDSEVCSDAVIRWTHGSEGSTSFPNPPESLEFAFTACTGDRSDGTRDRVGRYRGLRSMGSRAVRAARRRRDLRWAFVSASGAVDPTASPRLSGRSRGPGVSGGGAAPDRGGRAPVIDAGRGGARAVAPTIAVRMGELGCASRRG